MKSGRRILPESQSKQVPPEVNSYTAFYVLVVLKKPKRLIVERLITKDKDMAYPTAYGATAATARFSSGKKSL